VDKRVGGSKLTLEVISGVCPVLPKSRDTELFRKGRKAKKISGHYLNKSKPQAVCYSQRPSGRGLTLSYSDNRFRFANGRLLRYEE
jgi:hypothetical protein